MTHALLDEVFRASRKAASVLTAAAMLMALSVGASRADGISDGNAGLAAYKRGDYDEAIRLFTLALAPGRLSRDDSEFAYLNRGNAYAAKGENPQAISDLTKALSIRPDDSDARGSLQAVQARQAGGNRVSPVARGDEVTSGPWGILSAMAGKYYWYESPGAGPHATFLHITWAQPQQALSVIIRNKSDQLSVKEYKLDARTGKIIFAAVEGGRSEYGTVTPTSNGVIEVAYVDGTPIRNVTRLSADGSIEGTRQVYLSSSWRNTTSVVLVETDIDALAPKVSSKPRSADADRSEAEHRVEVDCGFS